jgi:MerR family transcriptional regulator, light-induced transcriptional regulator
MDAPRFGDQDDTPVYTIKFAVQQTGIAPATLRAWERRYGFLCANRTGGGYRLYSNRDIAKLNWLKSQVTAGIHISRAMGLLDCGCKAPGGAMQALREPILDDGRVGEPEVMDANLVDVMSQELLSALLSYSETGAESLLNQAFSLFSWDTVTEQIIAPALVDLGSRWKSRSASAVQGIFAANYLQRKLAAQLNAYPQPAQAPLAITGTAPGEWHDLGALLLSISLRRQGWRVITLGTNLPAPELAASLQPLQARLVCLSASTLDSALRLSEVVAAVDALPEPRPKLIFGGRIFNGDAELRSQFPDAYLAPTASAAARMLTLP